MSRRDEDRGQGAAGLVPAGPAPGFFHANWFLSASVRHATHMRKHVWKILCAQRDLLSPQAIEAVTASCRRLEAAGWATRDRRALEAEMSQLETVANKWLRPYPNASLRENVEVLLVAIAVAMAIRTFFAQPFKIPTGSMQPTLYGVTSIPDHLKPFDAEPADFQIPNRFMRYVEFWWSGIGYDFVQATGPGKLDPRTRDEPKKFLLFNLKQSFVVGDQTYTVWFPPDRLLQRAGLIDLYGRPSERVFQPGETLIKMKSFAGDHLFVDRFTYNFRRPHRGEIIVFETKDIPAMRLDQQGQFYIKRLVGLGGEKLQIGDDRHLVVDGRRLDASTPGFERVYSFNPSDPPAESKPSGHVNNRAYPAIPLAPLFPDANAVFQVPDNHYMVMGDNTLNSSDSRTWGSFPQANVIGKNWLVYWPIGRQDGRTSRFGWGNR